MKSSSYDLANLAENLKQNNQLEKIVNEFNIIYNLQPRIGAEIEFYLSPDIDVALLGQAIGYNIRTEKGKNQYEVDLAPSTNLTSYIEEINNLKSDIIKHAGDLGGKASFASKPFLEDYGSSMHFHVDFINLFNLNDTHFTSTMAGRRGECGSEGCIMSPSGNLVNHHSHSARQRGHPAHQRGHPELVSGSKINQYNPTDNCNYYVFSEILKQVQHDYVGDKDDYIGDEGNYVDNLTDVNCIISNLYAITPTSFRNDMSSFYLNLAARALCHYMLQTQLVFMPEEEDYLRINKNFMAPTHIAHGFNNRSLAVRVPDSLPKRLEYRLAGSNADPYLCVFAILKAILLGFKYPENIGELPVTYGNGFDPQYNLIALPKTKAEAQELFNWGLFEG